MKHKEGKNEYPSLVSDLRGSDFSFSAVSIMLALAFSHTAFNMLRKVPSMGLPWWLSCKGSACSAGDAGSIPASGRSPGGGNGNALQYACLKSPMGRGAWWATVHGVAKRHD